MTAAPEIANWEIFLWAASQLGGSSQFIDIEDIFCKCFEIAPARLGWRTRPEIPDYKKCAKALQEAEARRPRLLIKTGDAYGRQLTAEGQRWIEQNKQKLSRIITTGTQVPEPKTRPRSRMIAEIERSRPFITWRETGEFPSEKWRLAEVLRCSPDSSPDTWAQRLETARAAAYASDNDTVLRFFDAVKVERSDWFGGEGK